MQPLCRVSPTPPPAVGGELDSIKLGPAPFPRNFHIISNRTVSIFSSLLTLPLQFVVDGSWVTDPTAPQENDASGNLNNVLTTDRIVKHTPETAGIMSGVAPTSTTAELAKDVPLEKSGSSDLPGAFPETPAAVEKGDFSVAPLPAFDGAVNPVKLAPGEKVPHPSSFTNNTVTSGVHDDPELVAAAKEDEPEAAFSVNPLPAFPGAVNPVNIAPGDKLPEPSTITGNTINSAVTTDKESYEKSGGLGNAPVLPPVVTPQSERDQKGTGILDLPPISRNLIPESSLPMGTTGAGTFDASPAIQSSGPASTTAQLAAAVPLESSKVPEVVKESQIEAGVGPEASAVPAEVQEKSAVEKELLGHVPVAPATSEGVAGSSDSGNALSSAKDTPEVVKESIAESGQSPEAAANEEAVLEKKAVEKELLSEIKPETSTGESAPKIASVGTSGGLIPPASPSKLVESRDVSPGTVPGARTAATTDTTPAKDTTTGPSTPSKATPGSSKPAESPASVSTADKTDKKKKRLSFFGKLKAKLNDKKN